MARSLSSDASHIQSTAGVSLTLHSPVTVPTAIQPIAVFCCSDTGTGVSNSGMVAAEIPVSHQLPEVCPIAHKPRKKGDFTPERARAEALRRHARDRERKLNPVAPEPGPPNPDSSVITAQIVANRLALLDEEITRTRERLKDLKLDDGKRAQLQRSLIDLLDRERRYLKVTDPGTDKPASTRDSGRRKPALPQLQSACGLSHTTGGGLPATNPPAPTQAQK